MTKSLLKHESWKLKRQIERLHDIIKLRENKEARQRRRVNKWNARHARAEALLAELKLHQSR